MSYSVPSRKHTRYLYFLIWLTLSFCANPIFAQDFELIILVEKLTQEVAIGNADLAQWQSLQAAESASLAQNLPVQNYFETHFDVDGAYGELKTGAIMNDWEGMAKTMGTTGFALAGAYSVWRRRRLEYLEKLRSGDSAAIEDLFEEYFGQVAGELNAKTSDFANNTAAPQAADAWEA